MVTWLHANCDPVFSTYTWMWLIESWMKPRAMNFNEQRNFEFIAHKVQLWVASDMTTERPIAALSLNWLVCIIALFVSRSECVSIWHTSAGSIFSVIRYVRFVHFKIVLQCKVYQHAAQLNVNSSHAFSSTALCVYRLSLTNRNWLNQYWVSV